jgi:hypothetical protein
MLQMGYNPVAKNEKPIEQFNKKVLKKLAKKKTRLI